jgi:hypothetical protein
MFIEESAELGYHQLGKLLQCVLWWCQVMMVNLAVMAMGRRIQPYICLLTRVVLWTLTSVQQTWEIGTSSYGVTDKSSCKSHLYLMNLWVSFVGVPKLQISSSRVSKLLILFNRLFSSCSILRFVWIKGLKDMMSNLLCCWDRPLPSPIIPERTK